MAKPIGNHTPSGIIGPYLFAILIILPFENKADLLTSTSPVFSVFFKAKTDLPMVGPHDPRGPCRGGGAEQVVS